MRQAIFAGSFDPLTTGHLWMIREATKLFDRVHVLVAIHAGKRAMFSPVVRQRIIEQVTAREGLCNVTVDHTASEFVAQVARRKGVDYLIRGLRSTADFDSEDLLRQTNTDLFDGPQTVFLIPPKGLASVSSSFVKALMGPVGWAHAVSEFLPDESYQALLETHLEARWTQLVEQVGGDATAVQHFASAIAPSYRAPGRAYHTLAHLAHCLSELDAMACHACEETGGGVALSSQLGFAVFFHDLVYRGGPLAARAGESDEAASARHGVRFLQDTLKTSPAFCSVVERAILATRYSEPGTGLDETASTLQAVDLSILGRPEREYTAYREAIRKEFQDVPVADYALGRSRILAAFLEKAERRELFRDAWFARRDYNEQACRNLRAELEILKGGPSA